MAVGWENNIVGHDIKPASWFLASSKNIRIHPRAQQDATEGSLNTLGWVQSVTVNKRTSEAWGPQDRGVETLLNGHLRIMLALRRGDETPVPVEYVDLDESGEDIFLALMDEFAQMAMKDKQKLDALLQTVKPTDAALQQMLSELAAKEGLYQGNDGKREDAPEAQIDRAQELQELWQTSPGQLWVVDSKTVRGKAHRLLCGDSTKVDNVSRLMDGVSPLLACSDPPYGVNVDTRWLTALHIQRGKPANVSDDRLQGDDGSLDPSCAFAFPQWLVWGFPYLAHSEATGWLVWDKWPGVENGGGLGNPVEMASTNLWTGFRLVRVMWGGYYKAAGEHRREPHPTQKPVGVIAPYIEQFSKHGEVIADLFLGSGTTIATCEQLGRVGYGCDIEPKYIAVTLQRLADMGLQPRLVES